MTGKNPGGTRQHGEEPGFNLIARCWDLSYEFQQKAEQLDKLAKELEAYAWKLNISGRIAESIEMFRMAKYASMEKDHFNYYSEMFWAVSEYISDGWLITEARMMYESTHPMPFRGVIN